MCDNSVITATGSRISQKPDSVYLYKMKYTRNTIDHFSFLIPFFIDFIRASHIGLYASTGCFSHDMLTRNLADRLMLEGGHRVTIIQLRVYEFNRTMPAPKANWTYVSFNSAAQDSADLQWRLQKRMWLSTMPFDADRFDLENARILDRIHSYQMRACFRALRDPEFVQKIQNLNLDLLVVDYILNECALTLAHRHLKKVNIAYLANFPIMSSCVDNMGVSSNPAFVPSILGPEKIRMNAARRTANAFMYLLLLVTRHRFYWSVRKISKIAADIDLPSLTEFENRLLIFATPFEMFLDVPRPLATGLRYFGCEHCAEKEGRGNITQTLSLHWSSKSFILVSFGTVTKGDRIPMQHLIGLFRTFAKFHQYTIIWQLDAPREYFEKSVSKSFNTSSLPSHIHIFEWIPLKNFLTDPRVLLMVSHGGVTTCIEAVNSGVPVLGVAIQADQVYNLQRFVEKGVGEFLQAPKLNERTLTEKMSKMIRENARYKETAMKLRSMLQDYKRHENRSPSVFWLGWAARRFSKKNDEKNTWDERFHLSKHSTNWLIYYNSDMFSIFGGISFLFMLIAAC